MRTLRRMLIAVGIGVLCTAGPAMALVGNGFTVWSWGTTSDTNGINIGSTSNRSCFLSGVAGNLNIGGEWYEDEESTALVGDKYPSTGNYWLIAHGGAYTNQVNKKVWENNPVNARATCFWTALNVQSAFWKSGPSNLAVSPPVKIAPLAPGRRCFLRSVTGVAGAWNSSTKFARVVQKADGWYVEANLFSSFDGSHAGAAGRCVDFPGNTVFTSGTVSGPNTATITTGAGVKACALTAIQGAFNQNSWTNGALIQWPSTIDGNWTITVSSGKQASYTCAK